jgi:hypothetical protein
MGKVNLKDFLGGLSMLALAIAFTIGAYRLGLGTVRVMGAGYFPFAFGLIAGVLALITVISSLRGDARIEGLPWRPFFALSGAVLAFILLLPRVGLVPTVFVTALVAALADRDGHPLALLALAVALALGSWAVFVLGLGLPMQPYRIPF